jgi:hypothetical protein
MARPSPVAMLEDMATADRQVEGDRAFTEGRCEIYALSRSHSGHDLGSYKTNTFVALYCDSAGRKADPAAASRQRDIALRRQ